MLLNTRFYTINKKYVNTYKQYVWWNISEIIKYLRSIHVYIIIFVYIIFVFIILYLLFCITIGKTGFKIVQKSR